MNKRASLLLSAVLTLFALNSFAASPNPKPNCPKGLLPVMEQGVWQCKEPQIKARDDGRETTYSAPVRVQSQAQGAPGHGPKPNCPKGQIAKFKNGYWNCEEMSLTAPAKPDHTAAVPGHGPKPNCPKGQIAKFKNGYWSCEEMSLTAPVKPDHTAAVPGHSPKPNCPKGQIAKFKNGYWNCEEMTLTAPAKPDHHAAKLPKPNCTKGQLPKFENGQWVCRQPAFSAGGQNEE